MNSVELHDRALPLQPSQTFHLSFKRNDPLTTQQTTIVCHGRTSMWYNDGVASTVSYATHDLASTTWRSSWGLRSKRDGGLEIFTEGRRGSLRERRLEGRGDWSQVKRVGDLLKPPQARKCYPSYSGLKSLQLGCCNLQVEVYLWFSFGSEYINVLVNVSFICKNFTIYAHTAIGFCMRFKNNQFFYRQILVLSEMFLLYNIA
jgi:hypothetical protein